MFDYTELETTGYFYIEFDYYADSYLVEDLIRYWYRQWFKKDSVVEIDWINLNAGTIKDLVKITIGINNITSKNYVFKNFITAITAIKQSAISGDNRRSLRRVLQEGVDTSTCKLPRLTTTFKIMNEYNMDIPNPYKLIDFNINTTNELTELVTKLITEAESKLNQLFIENDTDSKYKLMRQQLDKIEKLEEILKLANELETD